LTVYHHLLSIGLYVVEWDECGSCGRPTCSTWWSPVRPYRSSTICH